MSLINITNLTFAYDGSYDNIFTDVSFQIDTDWKLGFCGRNGRGKTTFLNLLMGKYEYSGTISGGVYFEYFPFSVEDNTQNTLDILEKIAPDTLLWQIQKELSMLAVDESVMYRPFYTLSNGEQTKALLAGLFLRENSFLLIDEPTNHLDINARETVAQYLKRKVGFILISHDRTFLDECTDHTLSINKNNIEVVGGNFSVWWEQKQRQDAFELAQNEKLTKEIGRLESAARRTSKWSEDAEKCKIGFDPRKTEKSMGRRAYEGEKSRKIMARSKAIQMRQQSSIEEKSMLLKNLETAETLKIYPQIYHTSRLISLEKISISYGDRKIFHDVSFTLEQGDRLALLGENGSGKSSILKLICGEDIPHTGDIHIGSRLIISYIPQDASFLTGDLSEYAKEQQIDETLFKTILRKLDFSRVQFEKNMRDYSAGQKKKVLLARSLSERAHVYIWDEPLNYIDVLSRMQIEELIMDHRPTLLFVEHDRAFCDNIATKIINLRNEVS
ncbi:MAG: ABC-F type ribosomal protection protein [Eubacteriales bacterium]|nr:ABC-F type ribosomal protection protein [Oscillospiraceae bacterium]MDD4493626.1 ABC-F type ribosomal protection protein [Eubacteriales bacterium]